MEIKLPEQSSFFTACGARIREIKAIEKELDQCEHGLRAFQKLPRNMQRRAVSSNPQRLPRYLREKHKREVGSIVKQSKRPCRKYRRRPQNLLAEYTRRQRDQVWLETHIWHAKRFHMINRWGYRLPNTPNTKAFRASLRAATETCLLQDVSYECCFEIEGPQMEIQKSLRSLLSTADISCLMDTESKRGIRWQYCTLYKQNRCPFEAIGDAQLLWISSPTEELYPKLWLWVHPSTYEETLATLIKVLNLKKTDIDEDDPLKLLKVPDSVTEAKMATRNVPFQKTPKYFSPLIKLVVLKDTLVKFRLIGPKSSVILKKVLHPSQVVLENASQNSSDATEKLAEDKMSLWWVEFYSNPLHVRENDGLLSLWKSLPTCGSNSRRVLGLVVRDPRVILPSKKESLTYEEEIVSETPTIEGETVSALPIFDSAIRDAVTMSIKPTHAINTMRANLMVPGSPLPLTDEESRVPVLLLERSSSHVSGLGAGWDVVLPCGWGSQTLVAFALNGAVVAGQAEENTLKREFLIPPDPYQLPDTSAGMLQRELEKQEKEEEYFKRPPNCRLNFIKLAIRKPFSNDWTELVKNWNPTCNDFYVLRNKTYLKLLSLKSCKKIEKVTLKREESKGKRKFLDEDESRVQKLVKMDFFTPSLPSFVATDPIQMMQELKGALIYVRLVLIGKGSLEPFALICLPTEEDLKSNNSKGCCNLAEPPRHDPNSSKRKELQAKHKKDLTFLQRKRKKARNEVLCGEENPLNHHSSMRKALGATVEKVKSENKELVDDIQSYDDCMRKLWLKNPEDEKLQSTIRKIMGYSTYGGFCVKMGRPGGLGYVVSDALLKYMDQLKLFECDKVTSEKRAVDGQHKQILVLVRNPSCLLYRWARLVVLNVWH